MDYVIAKTTKLKDWYKKHYPMDNMSDAINCNRTFYDLFECLDLHKDVYADCIGEVDSIVRQRLFSRLAEIMKVDYDYIYNQWLLA